MAHRNCLTRLIAALVTATLAVPTTAAEPAPPARPALELAVEQGEFTFRPATAEGTVPQQFRMPERKFAFKLTPSDFVSTPEMRYSRLIFPSPVQDTLERNRTVHCEYFQPLLPGSRKAPGVIVLHILGGDFMLARAFCQHLAQKDVGALFLIMPHYGPRRTPGSPQRMVSEDPRQTVKGMTQAVLDIRAAGAFLASRPEIDSKQLGIMGISLGGITSALAAEAEPRFGKVGLLLAGGDISKVAWESPELEKVRKRWLAQGGTRESLVEVVRGIDPVTHAQNLHNRKVLMMNATRDEIIPKSCTESLWRAAGEPEIVWMDAGHISAAWHLGTALQRMGELFAPEK